MTEGWPKEESEQKMQVKKEIVKYKHKDPLPSPLPLLGRGSIYKKWTKEDSLNPPCLGGLLNTTEGRNTENPGESDVPEG